MVLEAKENTSLSSVFQNKEIYDKESITYRRMPIMFKLSKQLIFSSGLSMHGICNRPVLKKLYPIAKKQKNRIYG